eukprot:scaffold13378_cov163-Cylindrotheca_fusiformis.AAC.2
MVEWNQTDFHSIMTVTNLKNSEPFLPAFLFSAGLLWNDCEMGSGLGPVPRSICLQCKGGWPAGARLPGHRPLHPHGEVGGKQKQGNRVFN